jgi:hypothetical protein
MSKSADWIILPDMQVPYEDKRTMVAVERYMAANRWDGYLNLGDFLDFNELSSYTEDRPGAVREDVASTFDAGNEILNRHCDILRRNNRDCRMVLLQGNHDYRAVSYAEKFPALRRHLDVKKNLRLKERKIEWVPSWEKGRAFKIGHAHFIHGLYINKYHAMRMVETYGVCIYYGHTHDVSFSPKVTRGNNKTLEGGSLGCLCRSDPRWHTGKPTNWQQAVGTLRLWGGGGNYNLYTTRIFNHRFRCPKGTLYKG